MTAPTPASTWTLRILTAEAELRKARRQVATARWFALFGFGYIITDIVRAVMA